MELHFRTVKSTVQRDRSKAKSADIVGKECYAGLLADNLVRGLMAAAATQAGCLRMDLSFSRVLGLLAMVPDRLSACLSLKNEHLLTTWARHSVRAVVANPNASVGKRAAVFADGHLPALTARSPLHA